MRIVILSFLFVISSAQIVRWVAPLNTGNGNTLDACGRNNAPANPRLSIQTGTPFNLSWTINDGQPQPGSNLTFSIYRWEPNGNLKSVENLFTCTCSTNQNLTYPTSGTLPYSFKPGQRCDYAWERCALVVTHAKPNGQRVTACSDLLILSEVTNVEITISVTLPAGQTPVTLVSFQNRLFNNYGPQGTKKQLGFSAQNTIFPDSSSFQVARGKYHITFVVSDYLVTNNNNFVAYYSAANASRDLLAEPLGELNALADGVSSVASTMLVSGGGSDKGSVNQAAVIMAIILLVVIGGLLVFFLGAKFFAPEFYKKITRPCNAGSSTTTSS